MGASQRGMNLKSARAAEVATICLLLLLAVTDKYSFDAAFRRAVIGLQILPFIAALYVLRRTPTSAEWGLLSAFHQGLAMITGAMGFIFLVVSVFPQTVGIAELWPAVLFLFALAGLQLGVVLIARSFVSEITTAARNRKLSVLRVFSAGYFAVLFIMLK